MKTRHDRVLSHLYMTIYYIFQDYALYLERSNESGFYLNSLDIQRDIDYVEEKLLTELQNEIGIAVPRDFATIQEHSIST